MADKPCAACDAELQMKGKASHAFILGLIIADYSRAGIIGPYTLCQEHRDFAVHIRALMDARMAAAATNPTHVTARAIGRQIGKELMKKGS